MFFWRMEYATFLATSSGYRSMLKGASVVASGDISSEDRHAGDGLKCLLLTS